MKIKKVEFNNRRKVFTVSTASDVFEFPYSKSSPVPIRGNYVKKAYPDKELGNEAFTYLLQSGEEGTLHLDSVLEQNEDPDYMKDLLIYNLTLALRKQLEESPISKRELIKRMETSSSHFYRIIEPSNTKNSVDQILKLFYSLDCDLELAITPKLTNKTSQVGRGRTFRVSADKLKTIRPKSRSPRAEAVAS